MNLKDILNNKIILESKYNFIQQIFVNFSKGDLPSKNDIALLNKIASAPVRNQANDEIQISVDKFISENAAAALKYFDLVFFSIDNYDNSHYNYDIKNNKLPCKECRLVLVGDKLIDEAIKLYSKINGSWKSMKNPIVSMVPLRGFENGKLVSVNKMSVIVRLNNIPELVSLIDTKNAFNS